MDTNRLMGNHAARVPKDGGDEDVKSNVSAMNIKGETEVVIQN